MKGKLIAIEGIDGSGKNTQSHLLKEFLDSKNVEVELLHFPQYKETFFGKEIGNYLNGDFGGLDDVAPKLSALLFAGDRYEKCSYIVEKLSEGKIIICDRYVSSNIAHQGAKLSGEKIDIFCKWVETLEYNVFNIPTATMTIFLDVPPKITQELVLKKNKRDYTGKVEDIHEEDYGYMERVYNIYIHLCKKRKWEYINCLSEGKLKKSTEISKELIKIVKNI